MLLDANLLLYAVDEASPFHERAAHWLTEVMNGDERVALPWQSLGAFLRISTHPRAASHPLSSDEACARVRSWLDAEPTWVPPVGERTAAILGRLMVRHHVTGNLVPDAQLAAIAIERGLVLCSADRDFSLFDELRWLDPLRP